MTNRKRNKKSNYAAIARWAMSAGPLKAALCSTALALGIGYAIHTYFLESFEQENRLAAQQLSQLRSQNEANKKVEQTLPEFLAEIERAINNYSVARGLLPEEPEVSIVLDGVQQLAASRGVRITKFVATGTGVKSPLADKLNERVVPTQVIGSHEAVTRFLADVATYPRIIHVRNITLTSLKRNETADFSLAAYYAPSPADLPKLPPELKQGITERQ